MIKFLGPFAKLYSMVYDGHIRFGVISLVLPLSILPLACKVKPFMATNFPSTINTTKCKVPQINDKIKVTLILFEKSIYSSKNFKPICTEIQNRHSGINYE